MYMPVLLKGYIQGKIVSEILKMPMTLDCVSDPSSVGSMIAACEYKTSVTELVHGSFIDHTSTIGKVLKKSHLLPSRIYA